MKIDKIHNDSRQRFKYPDGYGPKINYWQGQFDTAKKANDYFGMNKALDKLIYFVNKQQQIYG
jgi:hypothetical protein